MLVSFRVYPKVSTCHLEALVKVSGSDRTRRPVNRVISAASGLFAIPHPFFAQGVYGSIYGTVFDISGAVVPETVTVKPSRVRAKIYSNKRYKAIPAVSTESIISVPDTYTVTITAGVQGLCHEAPASKRRRSAEGGRRISKWGAASQTVTVSASVEGLLKTGTARRFALRPAGDHSRAPDRRPVRATTAFSSRRLAHSRRSDRVVFKHLTPRGEARIRSTVSRWAASTSPSMELTTQVQPSDTSLSIRLLIQCRKPKSLHRASMPTLVGLRLALEAIQTKSGSDTFHGEILSGYSPLDECSKPCNT